MPIHWVHSCCSNYHLIRGCFVLSLCCGYSRVHTVLQPAAACSLLPQRVPSQIEAAHTDLAHVLLGHLVLPLCAGHFMAPDGSCSLPGVALPPAAGMHPQAVLAPLWTGNEQWLSSCRLISKPACSQQARHCSAVVDCEQHPSYTDDVSPSASNACALLLPAESFTH